MQVKLIKSSDKAITPTKAHSTDAGFDLTAAEKYYDEFGNIVYNTCIRLEIPNGYFGALFPRGSITKKALLLGNSVGVVDSDYRGDIIFKYKPAPYYPNRGEDEAFDYEVGDRVGQLIILPYPEIEFVETKDLSQTPRGEGSYGSTGK